MEWLSSKKEIILRSVSETLSSSNEYEPRDMRRNLDIYLNECQLHTDEMALLDGFIQLIKADLPLGDIDSDCITEAILKDNILPDYDIMVGNPRLAREVFALAPLRFLGPYVELIYEATEISQWYAKATEIASALTYEHTNGSCLAGGRHPPVYKLRALDGDPCVLSMVCPRKEMQRLLGRAVVNYQKEDVEYRQDAQRYVSIANAKLRAAMEQGLFETYYASTLLEIRDRQLFS